MGVIIRQSVKGTFVTYIGAFIGFLTTLYIIPKFIGEEIYGLTRVILEAGFLFAIIFQLGASNSTVRFFPRFKSNDRHNNGFFFWLMSLVTLGFLLFVGFFFLLKEPIVNYFSKESPLFVDYLYWLIPLTFFVIYWQTFEAYSNVLMRIAIPKFIREVVVRLLLIILYLAFAFDHLSLDGFIAGFVIIYGIAMLMMFFYISRIGSVSLRHDPSFLSPPMRKEFVDYTSIIILGSLGSTLISRIDIFMISGMEGLAMTGIYAIAYNMIAIVEMPSRSILAISSPIAADLLSKKDVKGANELYKKVSLHQLLIGSSIFILIWINIDNIFAIIPNGETYSAGKWVVLFIGVAKLFEITVNFGSVLIMYSKYYKWNLIFTLFISLITILLNYLLIPRYGISGAAVATALTILITLSLQQWLIFAKLKANPYGRGTLIVLVIIFISFGINYLLPELSTPIVDLLYRSAIIGALILILVYTTRVSPEVRNILNRIIRR